MESKPPVKPQKPIKPVINPFSNDNFKKTSSTPIKPSNPFAPKNIVKEVEVFYLSYLYL
jgi:hypothetical protein